MPSRSHQGETLFSAGCDEPGIKPVLYANLGPGFVLYFDRVHTFWSRETRANLAAGDHLPDGCRGRLLRQLYPGPCARVAQGGAFWLQ